MADLIPDRIPQSASQGEKRLFSILQRLPDQYIAYYEPIVNNRFPDFVVVCPDLGLMVIEVKGWYAGNIVAGDLNNITINDRGNQVQHKHPLRQARDYMYSLMDTCREQIGCEKLLEKEGPHAGKFIFPFGNFAVLSNITSEQLRSHALGDLTPIFPSSRVVPRDIFLSWESLDPDDLRAAIKYFFDPFWPIRPLAETQISQLRAIIHPEIVITSPPASIRKNEEPEKVELKVLDRRQENNARNIGSGHRLIYGVAGSGKTVLLISRAKICAQNPDMKILLLCFNVALSSYLKNALRDHSNVDVFHFDGWCRKNGVIRQWENGQSESNESLGRRLLQRLQDGHGDARCYDTVLIDEAQDFEASWFQCVLERMKEAMDGDLLIVGDASQGLYTRGQVSWKAIGVQAVGRTIYRKFDLDKNYRNSKEIVEVAAIYASENWEDDDDINAIPVTSEQAIRSSGFKPLLAKGDDRDDECAKAVNLVGELLSGRWGDRECRKLEPHEIGIMYPRLRKANRGAFDRFLRNLGEIAPTVWLSDPENREARSLIHDRGIKVQTIHSAKGLQYPAVILLWSDELLNRHNGSDLEKDKKLMYVALTRPEDFLAVTYSGPSPFVENLAGSEKMELYG